MPSAGFDFNDREFLTDASEAKWYAQALLIEIENREPTIISELYDVQTLYIMRYLKILPGEYQPIRNPVWISKVSTVTSDYAGIFYPKVTRGTYVEKGMRIGYVTDFYGKTIFEAVAPQAGVIL